MSGISYADHCDLPVFLKTNFNLFLAEEQLREICRDKVGLASVSALQEKSHFDRLS